MSGEMYVALGLSAEYAGMCGKSELESIYQNVFKKLVSFLYAHPKCFFYWSLSGTQLEYYSEKHPEFITLLSQLVGRKQVELLGGGYYEPILSILLPVDRVGQIEYMTSLQRKLVGKRPRGVLLSRGVWDAKIIDSLKNCGVDYVLLDSDLFPRRVSFEPVILENTGKTVFALPVNTCKPSQASDAGKFIASLSAASASAEEARIAVMMFEPGDILTLIEESWFEKMLLELETTQSVKLITPSMFFKESLSFAPAYIPPVMQGKGTIYEYLQNRTPLHRLYSRMIRVSTLVNQCRGDKSKKQIAREKLWEAQTGIFFCAEKPSFPEILALRRAAYRNLLQAENLAREITGFNNALVSFDVNSDGANEYICLFGVYNAFITPRGGSIYELDVFKSNVNYADTVLPSDFLDPSSGGEESRRNIFVDHLLKGDEDVIDAAGRDSVFPAIRYTESAFESKKKEIRLSASALFGAQPVSIKKNYLPAEYGVQVQYIIKNESPAPLAARFCVESSLSIPSRPEKVFQSEVISASKNLPLDSSQIHQHIPEVSLAVFTDVENRVSFIFEPNEDAVFSQVPVFCPPGAEPASPPYGVTGYFSWKVNLQPNMEMEKIINLNIVTPRKKKKDKTGG
ncbi:MAG: DUF1926 domain-containing protein [Spirochaetaceae bacterium]|jgi:hypothetical protein|nr:DUF1926 domain-containing protein [Spirochaetaceae bacterium]